MSDKDARDLFLQYAMKTLEDLLSMDVKWYDVLGTLRFSIPGVFDGTGETFFSVEDMKTVNVHLDDIEHGPDRGLVAPYVPELLEIHLDVLIRHPEVNMKDYFQAGDSGSSSLETFMRDWDIPARHVSRHELLSAFAPIRADLEKLFDKIVEQRRWLSENTTPELLAAARRENTRAALGLL